MYLKGFSGNLKRNIADPKLLRAGIGTCSIQGCLKTDQNNSQFGFEIRMWAFRMWASANLYFTVVAVRACWVKH